jgi:hypothetical protein
MPFYDNLAVTARVGGKTSAQFRAAAQRHANATWVYLIVAGIVWYFASWVWALLPLALAFHVAFKSVSSTAVAVRLEAWEKAQRP